MEGITRVSENVASCTPSTCTLCARNVRAASGTSIKATESRKSREFGFGVWPGGTHTCHREEEEDNGTQILGLLLAAREPSQTIA
jgi:hypothetical protein